VIINSDHQRALKGSKEFQKKYERLLLGQQIKEVNQALLSIDQDGTICKILEFLHQKFGSEFKLTFANGGDQTNNSIPEVSICQELGIELIDGLSVKFNPVLGCCVNSFD
jgi:hypothetical protein